MLSAQYKFLSYKIFDLLSFGLCCPGWLHPWPHPSLVPAQGLVKKKTLQECLYINHCGTS